MHVKLASQVPYQRPEMDRLVDLFFELQKLPLFEGSGFGAATIEEWFQYDARAMHMASQTDQDQERVRFRNLSSFLARLVKAGFEDSEMLYAFITLQEALEYEFEAANASHVLASEYLVSMAAEWIIMAGEAFLLDVEDADGYASQGDLSWEGEPRFSLGRWQFWTRRFGFFAGCEMLTEETRNAAKLAAEKMKCIEEQECEAFSLYLDLVIDN
ncbi:hypothetical protein DID88_006949 [Monilinia fructigena]|uniref:Uncharacterized protein n=1 Tax=Monilinia fructigena TaxID=38457 RepID=A0A395IH24_9HELO|nr:hypothetical protein DID88_006949 [Monilinia fructigena]